MAKRPSARRRVAPQHPSEPDDVFVARVIELTTWARRNSQALILGGIALALILGGVVYYANYRGTLTQQAVAELERVQQVVNFGTPDEAEVEVNRYLERFGGTRHATEARVLLGQLHLNRGSPQQAILALEAAPRSARDPMSLQARTLLGRAYEEVSRWPDAEREYLWVADEADLEFQRREALGDAARVRSQLGNHAGAAELYRRVLAGLDAVHAERGLWEMRLAEAEHEARG